MGKYQRQKIENLIKAVISHVKSEGGFVTKTKLIKYLYLIDIEFYKRCQYTFTGIKWIFYKFGPWNSELQQIIENMIHERKIMMSYNSELLDIDRDEETPLDEIFKDIEILLPVKRLVKEWADKTTGEMLNYVYFYTIPMENAQRGEPLDFSKIGKKNEFLDEREYVLPHTNPKILKKARDKLKEILENNKITPKEVSIKFTPPRYDEDFFEALDILNHDHDY